MREYTFPERRPPGVGPWTLEPDKVQWVDESTDLDCLIVRSPLGALCGYVGVPPGHPWHGQRYETVPADVHGGLTYSDFCQDGAEEGPEVCHVPEPGRPAAVWWLGFDCAHVFDLVPGLITPGLYDNPRTRDLYTYKHLGYVRHEVEGLAAQAHRAASTP